MCSCSSGTVELFHEHTDNNMGSRIYHSLQLVCCDFQWPSQYGISTAEDDLRPLNFGLAMTRQRAMDTSAWRLLVDATTSSWHAPERETERASRHYNSLHEVSQVHEWVLLLTQRPLTAGFHKSVSEEQSRLHLRYVIASRYLTGMKYSLSIAQCKN